MVNNLLILEKLRAGICGLSHALLEKPRTTIQTSFQSLDAILPGGGLPLESFVEILSEGDGSNALSFALRIARRALAQRANWAVVDTEAIFYPPAAHAFGFDEKRLILLRPRADDDAWAFTQLLQSIDVGVCFWVTRRMDNIVFRRLQLAAERGGGLGFVLRPLSAMRKPCWAGLRLKTVYLPNASNPRLRVHVLHASGRLTDSDRTAEIAL